MYLLSPAVVCKFDFPNENPEDVTPNKMCPVPDLHKNGGLVCVTVKQTHYCKPMCNQVNNTMRSNFYRPDTH